MIPFLLHLWFVFLGYRIMRLANFISISRAACTRCCTTCTQRMSDIISCPKSKSLGQGTAISNIFVTIPSRPQACSGFLRCPSAICGVWIAATCSCPLMLWLLGNAPRLYWWSEHSQSLSSAIWTSPDTHLILRWVSFSARVSLR